MTLPWVNIPCALFKFVLQCKIPCWLQWNTFWYGTFIQPTRFLWDPWPGVVEKGGILTHRNHLAACLNGELPWAFWKVVSSTAVSTTCKLCCDLSVLHFQGFWYTNLIRVFPYIISSISSVGHGHQLKQICWHLSHLTSVTSSATPRSPKWRSGSRENVFRAASRIWNFAHMFFSLE